MKLVKSVVASACLVLLSSAAWAQQVPPPPAPLVEAVRKAVSTNPEVQARFNDFRIAQGDVTAARAGFRPQVDATGILGKERQVRPTGSTGWYSRSGVAVQLDQMLFDGFFTNAEVNRFHHAQLVRFYETLEAAEQIALEAARAYIDVLRFRELVRLATDNYVEHKITTDQISERTTAGVGRRVDLEQSIGRLALAESNLLTELSNLHDVSQRYLRIMGELPPEKLPDLAEGLKLPNVPATLKEALEMAIQVSPEFNAVIENSLSSKEFLEGRKAAYYPRLGFQARQSWDRNLNGERGSSRDTFLGFRLDYNIYRGGADKARIQQGEAQVVQSADLVEKSCRDIRQQLTIAYNDVARITEQLTYLDQHRLSTEKAKEAYRQQFEIGQRTLLDLLDTQNEFFEASRAYSRSRHDQILAQARVLGGIGILVTSMEARRPDMPSEDDVGQKRKGIDPKEACPPIAAPMMVIDKAKEVAAVPQRPRIQELPPTQTPTNGARPAGAPAAPAAPATPAAPAAPAR
jgi:outer membrane protein, adhesin transport system